MRMKLAWSLGLLLALGAVGAAWTQTALPTLRPGAGQLTVQAICTRCHTIGIVIARPHTADEWDEIIGRMIDKGMIATDDQLDEVAAYLAKNYAPPARQGDATSRTAMTRR